jgi:hypothetical protein
MLPLLGQFTDNRLEMNFTLLGVSPNIISCSNFGFHIDEVSDLWGFNVAV